MSKKPKIIPYTSEHFNAWFGLMCKLFSDYPKKEIKTALKRIASGKKHKVYLAQDHDKIVAAIIPSLKSSFPPHMAHGVYGYCGVEK